MNMKYPQMRDHLLDAIAALADPEYQEQAWIRHQLPDGVEWDTLDRAISTILDDEALVMTPELLIGVILKSTEEVEAMRTLVAVMLKMNDLGAELPDEEYIHHPEWSNVIEAARSASKILT